MPFDITAMTTPTEAEPTEAETRKPIDKAIGLLPIYAALGLFLAAMVASVAFFGLPGLYLPAVALVPVMFVLLIRITLG